uniref:Metalloendopeptidase n=1 Tax=Cynoglossus semilaevis TaxID=244447 RepID=A0A3P8VJD0_CYNSE
MTPVFYSIISIFLMTTSASYFTDLFQEDIVWYKNRNAAPCTKYKCKWPKQGNHTVVPYVISARYSKPQITSILKGFSEKTCVKFVLRTNQRDYINIFSGYGCWSFVGRLRGKQPLSLNKYLCMYTKVMQHEFLHALGFLHEHSRSDRNEHVKINWHNIRKGKARNFSMLKTINYNISYDYNSVMQYQNKAFSKNGAPTIVVRDDLTRVLGKKKSMSDSDYARVNMLYECCKYIQINSLRVYTFMSHQCLNILHVISYHV